MRTIKCRAFLFDLDGTLVDSYIDAERCWTEWASSVGAAGNFRFAELYGRRRVEIIRVTLPDISADELAEHCERVRLAERENTSNVVALPGSIELLRSLPENSWAIVTSNDREVAQARIRAAEIPMPGILLSSDEVERGKPDPQGLLCAASMLNINVNSALVVDDSPVGIEAACRAHMPSVGVLFRHDFSSLYRADFIIRSLFCLSVERSSDGFVVALRQGA
jgi:mannitol-1-/sugar-/sorbitol-6-phosphatase